MPHYHKHGFFFNHIQALITKIILNIFAWMEISLKIFHSTLIHDYVVDVVVSAGAHVLNFSSFPQSPKRYVGIPRFLCRGHASITFLFNFGWLLNLPFAISSVTDIVAFEIFSPNFLDAQSNSSCFIFQFSQFHTGKRGKKIRALVRLKAHMLYVNQSSRQPENHQVRADRMAINCIALESNGYKSFWIPVLFLTIDTRHNPDAWIKSQCWRHTIDIDLSNSLQSKMSPLKLLRQDAGLERSF